MTTRRNAILNEIGLTPLWHKKQLSSNEQKATSLQDLNVMKTNSLSTASNVQNILAINEGVRSTLSVNWDELKISVKNCRACGLCETRTQTVFGVGDESADWLLVGEGPGAEEDLRGEPFVGQAGKLLDNMLNSIDLKRGHNVYIANTVKCRPPGNRHPQPDEMEKCFPFLIKQIQLIQPKLILALGKAAVQALLNTDIAIARLRGKVHEYHQIPLIVTYHPAYLLRNLPDKFKAWEDLCFARKIMQGL